ncbi:hypothetical protein BH11PLA2_BH11PLA2_37820 [soil metagenome]
MSDWKKQAETEAVGQGISSALAARVKAAVLADSSVNREEVEFLLALRSKAKSVAPEFTAFVFEIVLRNVLKDGEITPGETAWLRKMIFTDGHVDTAEREFLKVLKEAVFVSCPAFDELCAQYESV